SGVEPHDCTTTYLAEWPRSHLSTSKGPTLISKDLSCFKGFLLVQGLGNMCHLGSSHAMDRRLQIGWHL
ncbi:MAG: hypothetical protein ACI8UZ_003502, partial [Akkermansiaceae bacterium]